MIERFVGKFQATVVDNDDPLGLARLRLRCDEVFQDETFGWALPSTPYSGENAGLAAVPPKDSLVWVEWPAGDTSRVAIWSGGSWARDKGVPDAGPEVVLLVTPAGHRIALKDSAGSESIEVKAVSGARILLDSNGISIEFGSQKIALTTASVSINDGALEVM